MTDNNAEGRQDGALSPQALRLADMTRVLSASGPQPVTVEMLQADIDAGVPVSAQPPPDRSVYEARGVLTA